MGKLNRMGKGTAVELALGIAMDDAVSRHLRAGANIAPTRAVGHRTWEEFLAAR